MAALGVAGLAIAQENLNRLNNEDSNLAARIKTLEDASSGGASTVSCANFKAIDAIDASIYVGSATNVRTAIELIQTAVNSC